MPTLSSFLIKYIHTTLALHLIKYILTALYYTLSTKEQIYAANNLSNLITFFFRSWNFIFVHNCPCSSLLIPAHHYWRGWAEWLEIKQCLCFIRTLSPWIPWIMRPPQFASTYCIQTIRRENEESEDLTSSSLPFTK